MEMTEPMKAAAQALGKVPSGLFVLSSGGSGQTAAILASWVQQAALNPLALSVAVANERTVLGLIRQSRSLALSVLPEGDASLIRRFARGVETNPFDGMATLTTPSGQLVLAAAAAWLDCQLISVCEFGADHTLLVAQVLAGKVLGGARPMVHLRGSALHY
jgi:flavin reductase (DIM6/NTAB) family NADH-FMN oxidoreductase RutF